MARPSFRRPATVHLNLTRASTGAAQRSSVHPTTRRSRITPGSRRRTRRPMHRRPLDVYDLCTRTSKPTAAASSRKRSSNDASSTSDPRGRTEGERRRRSSELLQRVRNPGSTYAARGVASLRPAGRDRPRVRGPHRIPSETAQEGRPTRRRTLPTFDRRIDITCRRIGG